MTKFAWWTRPLGRPEASCHWMQRSKNSSAGAGPMTTVVVTSLSGGRFVTFFYATVDTAAMKLRWSNAGHNAPILARADGTMVRLAEGGPAISRLFRDTAYEERELDLLRILSRDFAHSPHEVPSPLCCCFGSDCGNERVREFERR